MRIESYSPVDTMKIAAKIAKDAIPGGVYGLSGDLGVGKTIFVKGFAQGLCIHETITSPTFTIVNEYHDGRLPLHHFDAYRIHDASEMENTGYDAYFYGEGVCMVEWPERIGALMPEDAVSIHISKDMSKGEDYRLITID